jgi:hypothetical protein
MLRHVALVRTDVSEEPGASFIRVTKIGELGTTQAATSNRRTLRKEAPGSSETSVLKRATRCNIPEDTILHSHRRENLKSYKEYVPPRRWLLHKATGRNITEDAILHCFLVCVMCNYVCNMRTCALSRRSTTAIG